MKYIKIGKAYQIAETFSIKTTVLGYRVSHPLYDLYPDGTLIVRIFYAWDGASGWFDVKSIMLASCGHDVLTEIINDDNNDVPPEMQAMADETFRILEDRANMPVWEQTATYLAVRWYQMRKKYPIPPRKIYDTNPS